jgi:hypothetical protein
MRPPPAQFEYLLQMGLPETVVHERVAAPLHLPPEHVACDSGYHNIHFPLALRNIATVSSLPGLYGEKDCDIQIIEPT